MKLISSPYINKYLLINEIFYLKIMEGERKNIKKKQLGNKKLFSFRQGEGGKKEKENKET